MKKLIAGTLASLTFVFASVAMAAPPAAAAQLGCAHCSMTGAMKTPVGTTRGALYGTGHQPCQHTMAADVRWGSAQKPCMHCNHTA
jgi:hypothetical protein